MTIEIQSKKEIPIIGVEFVYDPAFCPQWLLEQGEVICQISPEKVREYLPIIKKQWEAYKRPISESLHKHLETPTSFFWERRTCHILDKHVKLGEKYFLNGLSHPLTVMMDYPDEKWGFLPFFGNLTHELVHIFGPLNDGVWENWMDKTAQGFDKPSDFWAKDPKDREELAVQKVTCKILEDCFGQEFTIWHKITTSPLTFKQALSLASKPE